jgi:hypothetical protein
MHRCARQTIATIETPRGLNNDSGVSNGATAGGSTGAPTFHTATRTRFRWERQRWTPCSEQRPIRLYAGCSVDEFKRDLQEVEYTNEAGCWGKAGIQKEKINFTLQYGRTQRNGSSYLTNPTALRRRIR